MHIAQCKILSRRLRFRSSATFNHENLHRHSQCRSPYKGRFTWLAVHFRPKSSYAYYFDSYGIVPFVPDFVQQNSTTWDRNKRQLQSLTSDVCGKYCCLFALYMDRATLPSNSWLSLEHQQTGRWRRCSRPNSGLRCLVATGVNAVTAVHKR